MKPGYLAEKDFGTIILLHTQLAYWINFRHFDQNNSSSSCSELISLVGMAHIAR